MQTRQLMVTSAFVFEGRIVVPKEVIEVKQSLAATLLNRGKAEEIASTSGNKKPAAATKKTSGRGKAKPVEATPDPEPEPDIDTADNELP